MTAPVCLVFFLSGAAALLFETLWFRLAGLVFGNSVWAASVVLASFMGGLALGNTAAARYGPRLRRPLRVYALLELLIGATGLALVLLLPSMTAVMLPALRPFTGRPAVLNAVRLSLSFALLLVPSTAMGATLPLLVKALSAAEPNFGRILGRLYGWNTLGAAAGAVAGEFALITVLGLRLTGVVAAALDVVAAVVASSLSRRASPAPAETGSTAPAPLGGRAARLMAAAFLSGAILLALEVVWLRFLLLFLSGTSPAFAAMLSVVLLGIGAGGLAASLWTGRDAAAHRWLPALALLAGVALISTYVTFDRVLALQPEDYSQTPRATFLESCWLMLAVCFVSGILFTLIGRALRDEVQGATRAAGLLTLANTTGAMLGGPLAGFVLLPGIGMERSLFVLAAAYGLVALLTSGAGSRAAGLPRAERYVTWAAAAAFATFVALFPFGLMTRRYLALVVQRFAADGSRAVALKEGLTETVLVLRKDTLGEPLSYRLVTNGFSMSGTGMISDRYMKLFVYWPVAVHPRLERALLISYGAGTTARALAGTAGLRSVDVVDISREILGMARVIFAPPRRSPLLDPRFRVHVEDGRYFLASTRDRFDLITAEPPPPGHAGVVNLYSREYFQLVHDRLAEGGIATHWLPVFLMPPESSRSVIRAFCDVFEDCSLWSGAGLNWMLVGSRGGLAPVSEDAFSRQWRDPSLAAALREEALESPEVVGTTFMGDAPFLRELTRSSAPVIDDRPHRISPSESDLRADLPYYRSLMDTAATRARFEGSPAIRALWPAGLRARSLEAFDYEQALNGYLDYPEGGRIPRLEALLLALQRTSSRTLPLWLMDTQEPEVRAAARAPRGGAADAQIEYLLALEAMARRDYRACARGLERLRGRLPPHPRMAIVRALALHLAGDGPGAQAEAASSCAGAPPVLDPETCDWLRALPGRALLSGEPAP
jgi:predicted membrane-bound spermidine synthase